MEWYEHLTIAIRWIGSTVSVSGGILWGYKNLCALWSTIPCALLQQTCLSRDRVRLYP